MQELPIFLVPRCFSHGERCFLVFIFFSSTNKTNKSWRGYVMRDRMHVDLKMICINYTRAVWLCAPTENLFSSVSVGQRLIKARITARQFILIIIYVFQLDSSLFLSLFQFFLGADSALVRKLSKQSRLTVFFVAVLKQLVFLHTRQIYYAFFDTIKGVDFSL